MADDVISWVPNNGDVISWIPTPGVSDNTPGYNYGVTTPIYADYNQIYGITPTTPNVTDTNNWMIPSAANTIIPSAYAQQNASSFNIPNEFSQANPYAQQTSGSIGGNISGPGNPYNNSQFIDKPVNPIDALISNWQNVFGDIAKGSFLSGLVGPTKGAGVGIAPAANLQKQAIQGPITGQFANSPTPNAAPTQPVVTAPPGTPPTAQPTTKSTAVEQDKITEAATWLAQNPKVTPEMLSKQAAFIASSGADPTGIVAMDIAAHQKGLFTAKDEVGNVVPLPLIGPNEFNNIQDKDLRAYFWNNYNGKLFSLGMPTYRDVQLEQDIQDATNRLHAPPYGVPQMVDPSNLKTYNVTRGMLLGDIKDAAGQSHSIFAHNLLNDGYKPSDVDKIESYVKEKYLWAKTPPGIRNDPTDSRRFGPIGGGDPYWEVTIPGVLNFASYESALAYRDALAGLFGKDRTLTAQGTTHKGGAVDIQLEKMARGNFQIVPQYNNVGQIVGIGVMTRKYGFEEPEGNTNNRAEAGGGGGSITQNQYAQLEKSWKKSGSSLSFEDWLAEFNRTGGKSATSTTGTRSKRGRLRSVSY